MNTPSERIFIDGRYWLLGSSVDDKETLTIQYDGSESKCEFYRLDPNQEPSSKVKATLEFNLPDDEYAFKSAINGAKYRMILSDFKEWLFSKVDEAEIQPTSEEILGVLRELISDEGVEV